MILCTQTIKIFLTFLIIAYTDCMQYTKILTVNVCCHDMGYVHVGKVYEIQALKCSWLALVIKI